MDEQMNNGSDYKYIPATSIGSGTESLFYQTFSVTPSKS